MNKRICSPVFCFQPEKQFEDPNRPEAAKEFSAEELEETKTRLRTPQAEEHAREEAAQKVSLWRDIRTRQQKLQREVGRKGCTPERKKEIKADLENLKELEEQECRSELCKCPSVRRPTAEELGFKTNAPRAEEILERATIRQGLRLRKPHLFFAKLAKKDPARWREVAKREAQLNPEDRPGQGTHRLRRHQGC